MRCDITNTAIAPTITLVKKVSAGEAGGDTRPPQDWTLSAEGPRLVSGQSGTPQVTNVAVGAGTYLLRESGPKGYAASEWDCAGAIVTGNQLSLPLGYNAICTITNTKQAPALTLVKEVDNTGGGTAKATDWTLTAAGQVTLSGATGTPAVTNIPVKPGTYELSESGGPPGYAAAGFRCDGGSQVGPFLTITEGLVTCTIRNTAVSPRLTLVKKVENAFGGQATATAWTLSAAGPTGISGRSGEPAVTDAAVSVGTYTLAESGGPAGYAAGPWSCTGGSLTGNRLTLALSDQATCTIVNRDEPAHLTLRKLVDGAHLGTSKTPADWTLSATPDGIPGQQEVSGNGGDGVTREPVFAGRYTLGESGPAGFTAGGWQCSGATVDGSTMTVVGGADVICTITNTVIEQRLTLVKDVDNGRTGATGRPADWTLTAAGPATITGASGSPAVTAAVVPAGTYALSESGGQPGYTGSAWSCTGASVADGVVTVPLGGDVSCRITNSALSPRLTLVKRVDNQHGGAASPTDWTLTAAGPATITGRTGDPAVTGAAVPVGAYLLAESGGSDGYTAGAWSCSAGSLAGHTLTLSLGAAATCTIVNQDTHATLTLRKQVDPGHTGSTKAPKDWTMSATPVDVPWEAPVSGNGADGVTGVPVSAGQYALSEQGPGGFAAGEWDCTGAFVDGATLTVANGADVTFTITNTAKPATLTLTKTVDNGQTGATTTAQAWTLTATGPATITGTSGTAPVTAAVLPVGAYALNESGGPGGYAASAWTCAGATVTDAHVTLVEGTDATCTVTTTAVAPTLTLVKQVDNRYGGTATPADFTLTATGPTTLTGTSGTTAVTNRPVATGAYALAESGGPGGYDASGWICTSGTASGSSVVAALGEAITCTVVNRDRPPIPPSDPGGSSGSGGSGGSGGSPSALPATGLTSLIPLWWGLLLVLAGATVLLARPRRS